MFTKHCSTKHAGWLALSFILSTGMILTTLPAAYAVPMMTNYQGTLKDVRGRPVNNATVNLTFALYNVPEGGTPLWTEIHSKVVVKSSIFNVYLGSINNFPQDVIQGERYLGVRMNNDAELLPRQAITSNFFAMRAGVAESVASGSVTNDKLGAASVTSEKVADGAVSGAKLAASAVTGDKLAANVVTTDKIANGAVTSEKVADGAVSGAKLAASAVTGDKLVANVVTTDKIANGAVTTEKLSTEVQGKLAQSGSMPATVTTPVTMTTLNVTEKLKVGKNSLYLGPFANGGTDNSIYTDGSDLLLQSLVQIDPTTPWQNTVINANNTGKVGIGTENPQNQLDAKLTVKGDIFLLKSPAASPKLPGFQIFYDDYGAELTALLTTNPPTFEKLMFTGSNVEIYSATEPGKPSPIYLTGSPIILNGKYSPASQQKNVSIGTSKSTNMLDVAGSVAIGSGYAGIGLIAPANGLLVEGDVGIGGNPNAKLDVRGILKASPGVLPEKFFPNFGRGLYMRYDSDDDGGDIGAVNASSYKFTKLFLSGNPIVMNTTNGTGNVGIGTTTPRVKLDVRADPPGSTNTTALWVSNDDAADWGYNTIFKVTRDNTKAIAVRKEKADEWNGPETFVLYGSGAVWANGSWRWSDKRWKEDIKPLQNTLDKVVKLQGVSYKWNKKTRPTNDDRTHIGFVAQEVETVLPEMVSTDEKGFKAVAYDEMTAVLVEAVKELKAQNDALKTIVCKDHPEEAICQ